jgi:hypothetical protein
MWVENNEIHAKLYLLDRDYDFILSMNDMSKNQTKYYSVQGTWTLEENALSIHEAFNG